MYSHLQHVNIMKNIHQHYLTGIVGHPDRIIV